MKKMFLLGALSVMISATQQSYAMQYRADAAVREESSLNQKKQDFLYAYHEKMTKSAQALRDILVLADGNLRDSLFMDSDFDGNLFVAPFCFHLAHLDFFERAITNSGKNFLDLNNGCYHYAYWNNGVQVSIEEDLRRMHDTLIGAMNAGFTQYTTVLRSGRSDVGGSAHYYTLVIQRNALDQFTLSVINSTRPNDAVSDVIEPVVNFFNRHEITLSNPQEFCFGTQVHQTSCGLWAFKFATDFTENQQYQDFKEVKTFYGGRTAELINQEAAMIKLIRELSNKYFNRPSLSSQPAIEESKNEGLSLDDHLENISSDLAVRGCVRNYMFSRFSQDTDCEAHLADVSSDIKVAARTLYEKLYGDSEKSFK